MTQGDALGVLGAARWALQRRSQHLISEIGLRVGDDRGNMGVD
jgi:hypothetical protein